MAIVSAKEFQTSLWMRWGHVQTIRAAFVQPPPGPRYVRERLELADGDFVDLDWAWAGTTGDGDAGDAVGGKPGAVAGRRVAVLCHGLESSSEAYYMRSMAQRLNAAGWDVCAYNLRGCSGEPNRLLRAYHSGDTVDLAAVLRHVATLGPWERRGLLGFSLGGNLALKLAGEQGASMAALADRVAGVSVPCDLGDCARHMDRSFGNIYRRRFVRELVRKVGRKTTTHREALAAAGLDPVAIAQSRTFAAFDGAYTAPVNGFPSADVYWREASCLPVLEGIAVPTLLLSALDDPLLTPVCFPTELAREHRWLDVCFPSHGGHVAFLAAGVGRGWHETVMLKHLNG